MRKSEDGRRTEALIGNENRRSGVEENRSRTGGMRKSEDGRRTEALIGNEGRRSGEEENRSRTGG